MSSITSIIGGASTAIGATVACTKGKEEDRKARRNIIVGTSLVSTATTIASEVVSCSQYNNYYTQEQLRAEQSMQAYVDSLSREELEIAKQQIEEQKAQLRESQTSTGKSK